jgi:hypothetical protein
MSVWIYSILSTLGRWGLSILTLHQSVSRSGRWFVQTGLVLGDKHRLLTIFRLISKRPRSMLFCARKRRIVFLPLTYISQRRNKLYILVQTLLPVVGQQPNVSFRWDVFFPLNEVLQLTTTEKRFSASKSVLLAIGAERLALQQNKCRFKFIEARYSLCDVFGWTRICLVSN